MSASRDMEAAVMTISDRCYQHLRQDESGPGVRRLLESRGWKVVATTVCPDEQRSIEQVLYDWIDERKIPLVVTTGGTGAGPRDITPEVCRRLLEKELPGLPELMRLEGLKKTPLASLSRGVAGVRKKTLLVNLPGSPKGAEESLSAVVGVIPHLLEMVGGGGHGDHAG